MSWPALCCPGQCCVQDALTLFAAEAGVLLESILPAASRDFRLVSRAGSCLLHFRKALRLSPCASLPSNAPACQGRSTHQHAMHSCKPACHLQHAPLPTHAQSDRDIVSWCSHPLQTPTRLVFWNSTSRESYLLAWDIWVVLSHPLDTKAKRVGCKGTCSCCLGPLCILWRYRLVMQSKRGTAQDGRHQGVLLNNATPASIQQVEAEGCGLIA